MNRAQSHFTKMRSTVFHRAVADIFGVALTIHTPRAATAMPSQASGDIASSRMSHANSA